MIRNLKVSSLKEKAEFKAAIREQTEVEYNSLKIDIEKNGQLDPIRIDGDKNVLDGYSRLKIAKELKWEAVKTIEIERPFISIEEAVEWIRKHNHSRRHFTKEERDNFIAGKFEEVTEQVGEQRGKKRHSVVSSTDQASVEKEEEKSAAKLTAEALEKEHGIEVSEKTVQRVVKKAKEEKDSEPKKEKPLPKVVKACIMFRRTSVKSWEGMREIYPTKAKSQEYVKAQREEGNPMFDVEIQYLIVEIPFFTDYDKKSFMGIRKS